MAAMFGSALVQEAVSRAVSFVLGKREEKASQGHLMERLEMAVSELEFALERAQELPIRHLSLLGRRKQIKLAYVEAMELLGKHKQQQEVPGGRELMQDAHGVKKRKLWVNMSVTSCFAALSTDDVRRYEWFADRAGKFLRDVESGCSLHHNTFCNSIVRHLLEGKTLRYSQWEQGNVLRGLYIWPMYSDECGVEAVLAYSYGDSTMTQKYFSVLLYLRLSESTDIFGVAIKGLQLLTSEFKLVAECAMGELTMLSNLQDIAHSYDKKKIKIDRISFRPDPACCKGSRHGVCANNNISSESVSDIFPEQVICWGFWCYYVPAPFDVAGRSKSRGRSTGGKPHLLLTAVVIPHDVNKVVQSISGTFALETTIGDDLQYIDVNCRGDSIQQMMEAIKSDRINCFFRQPGLTKYQIFWLSKHGSAAFTVEKEPMERASAPKTRRRYNTRGKLETQEVACRR